jgi:hypothetical protein
MNAMPVVSYLSYLSMDDINELRRKLDPTLADKVISMFNFYKNYNQYELRILSSDIMVDRREIEYMCNISIEDFELEMKRRCLEKMLPYLSDVVDTRSKQSDSGRVQLHTARLHVLVKND